MTRNDIYQNKPASVFGNRWRDCTPLGNGYTGVTLYGGVSAERLAVSRSDLWFGGREQGIPDVSDTLETMRALERCGKPEEACNMMYEALNKAQYSTNVASMRTLGCVQMIFNCNGIYSRYQRILHMDRAESEIRYQLDSCRYERSCFVSRKRDVIVMRVRAEEEIDFSLKHTFFDSYEGSVEWCLRDQDAMHARHTAKEGCMVYSSNSEGKYFGLVTRVYSDGEIVSTNQSIEVSRAKDSLILIKAFSQEDEREKAENTAVASVNACPCVYEQLFEENLELYGELYNKTDISLYAGEKFHSNEELLADARYNECSAELVEKLWRFGRYLFISGVEKDGLPFPLYGLWPSGYARTWPQHVGNENVQMIHWHVAVGGLIDLIPSLIDFYYSKMNGFRQNARNLFGCRGIFVGAYLSPNNELATPHVPVIIHFIGVAGWLCRHFYEYYLCTKDEELFAEKILPFMLETIQFYEDYIYLDEHGKIELYPAVSPENTPHNFQNVECPTGIAHPMPVTKNPTMEFAILKELLSNLIRISETHPELQTRVGRWRDIRSRIPEYRINKDGAIAEWMSDENQDHYEHRHLSHVYPIFPGMEIEEQGMLELVPAFEKATQLRKLGYMTGWSLAHMSAIYARLNKKEQAFQSINMLTKVCLLDNFFTLHNDYRDMGITTTEMGGETFAPVQLDALMGTVNAVQEMLLFVSATKIKLLPACPKQFNSGSAKLCFYDGTIHMRWNIERKMCEVNVVAIRDTEFILELPFGEGSKVIQLSKDESYAISM